MSWISFTWEDVIALMGGLDRPFDRGASKHAPCSVHVCCDSACWHIGQVRMVLELLYITSFVQIGAEHG